MRAPQHQPAHAKQRGAALMVMLVIMVMGAAAFLVSSLSRSALRIQQNQDSSQILVQTKNEVMGFIMSGAGGLTPLSPDMLSISETPPYNYDGTFNSGCLDASQPSSTPTPGLPLISIGANMRCLGRLPWKAYGMSISSPSENDPTGTMPWYAISANLADPANVVFNSDILNLLPPSNCPPSPAAQCLKHTWLTVRDMNGNVLSSRVAIVIIIPGPVLPGQSRPSSPLGGPNQYLDSISLPVGCGPTLPAPTCSITYSNHDLDDDFIMGDERRWIPDPGNPASQIEDSSYQFNDKLIYITIDELMPLIEKRVGNEVKKQLKAYYAAWGAFPFAAPFADPSSSTFTGQASTYNGLLPVGNTITPVWNAIPTVTLNGTTCDAGTTPSCTCSLRPTTGTINTYWRCNFSGITGTPTIRITGTLNSVGLGMRLYDPSAKVGSSPEVGVRISSTGTTYNVATTVMSNVSFSGSSIDASGNATVTFSGTVLPGVGNTPTRIQLYPGIIPSHLPSWFGIGANNWNQVMYYATSPGYAPAGGNACNPLPGTPSCLTVNGNGGGNDKRAVVVMTSGALANQATHPTGTLADYLEAENATPIPPIPTDYIYENKSRSNIFNDQVIVVAPFVP